MKRSAARPTPAAERYERITLRAVWRSLSGADTALARRPSMDVILVSQATTRSILILRRALLHGRQLRLGVVRLDHDVLDCLDGMARRR